MDDLVLFAWAWLDNETTDFADYADKISENPRQSVVKDTDEKIYTLAEFAESSGHAETLRDENDNIIAQIVYDDEDRIIVFTLYPSVGGKIVIFTFHGDDSKTGYQVFLTYDDDGNIVSREEMPLLTASAEKSLSFSGSSSFSVAEIQSLEDGGMMMAMSSPESPAAASEIFLYDHLGNRYQETAKNGFTYTYTQNLVNQYERKQTNIFGIPIEIDYSHDDNGNLQFDEHWNSYSYDYRNRLNKVEDYESNIVAEYGFDALGRRFKKTMGGTTTYFIYDMQGRVIAEYEQDALKREFVYGNRYNEVVGMFLAEHEGSVEDWQEFLEFCEVWLSDPNDSNWDSRFDVVADNRINLKDFAHFASQWDMPSNNETRFYYLRDALGSVRGLIGGRFNRESDREFYNYDVYGKSSDTSAVGNPFRFAGYYFDSETGLYHTPFRTYDPETGRWLQLDPIGNAYSMNLYEYVLNNPTMYFDPFGLYEEEWEGKWTEDEKKRIRDSMERVRKRNDELVSQIKEKLKSLPKSRCYDELRKELNFLLKYMERVSKGIQSTSENLEFYQKDMGGNDNDAMAGARTPGWGRDNELYFNTNPKQNWKNNSDRDLDVIMLHELTHLYGSRDPKERWWDRAPRGRWDNAHYLGRFMETEKPLDRNIDYRDMQNKAQECEDKKCNHVKPDTKTETQTD